MSTLGAMIAEIREDLDRGSDYDARIQKAIVKAIAFYKARRFHFNTGRSTRLVTAERTSLSADMILVDRATLQVDGTELRELKPRTAHWIEGAKTQEDYTSEPIYYAIEDRQLRLHPPPDRSYSVELSGVFDFPGISLSVSDSTTTNAWMNLDSGYDLIRLHAQAEVLELHIKGPDAEREANLLRRREIDVEREIKRRTNAEHQRAVIRSCM
jgi:hypothetical protein